MTGYFLKSLPQLFEDIPVKVLSPHRLPVVPVTGIALDSRQVQKDHLFVALTGENIDGHHFIPAAIERGASAVVGSLPPQELPVPYIQVADCREALAYLSASFYHFPARRLTMIGVTGTDGKTTTASLIYEILLASGFWAGMISTVNALIGAEVLDTGFHVTTPEAPDVQRYLHRMTTAGLTHAVLESTSHGLAQHRVTACDFDIAVVTNITHEHLDYHGSYEAYRAAKASLFAGLAKTPKKEHSNPRLAVLNRDDQSYEYLHDLTTVRQISYGLEPGAVDLWAEDIHYDSAGLHFTAVGPGIHRQIDSSLIGAYNVSNILAALGATVVGLKVPLDAAVQGVSRLQAIPGRMERINLGQNFIAIVDFAHTPNALKNALETVREMTGGRVLAVFGSAGLRDRQKRRMMAEVSIGLADVTILTAEDPRTEALEDILAEMAAAAAAVGGVEGQNFYRVADRGAAIAQAIRLAQPGDVVVACGKGHEQSMCFGETEYSWDDRTAMRAALSRHIGVTGPPMPYLPTQE